MDLFHTEPCKVIRVTFNAAIFALAANVCQFSKENYPNKTGYTVLSAFTLIFSILVAPLLICVILKFKFEVQKKALKWCDQNGCKLPGLIIGILPFVHIAITSFTIGPLSVDLYVLVAKIPNERDHLKLLIVAFLLEFANLTF